MRSVLHRIKYARQLQTITTNAPNVLLRSCSIDKDPPRKFSQEIPICVRRPNNFIHMPTSRFEYNARPLCRVPQRKEWILTLGQHRQSGFEDSITATCYPRQRRKR